MVDLNLDRNLKALPRALGCLFLFFVALLAFGIYLSYMLFGPVTNEYVDLPGSQAVQSFGWQNTINPSDVIKVSRKYISQRDTHSAWTKIEITPAAAKTWEEKMHTFPTAKIDTDLYPGELREWLNSEVTPPLPVFNDEITPPTWWQPPAIKFHATQQIRWYASFDSGYGNALYSAYDEPSRILWIYDFGGQHRCFWKKGQFPPGTSFTQNSAPLPPPQPVPPKP